MSDERADQATHDAVCIIGAGPVGLAVAKALGEAQVPYVHLEATDHVGGNWAHGVYETAHIISSRKTTEYPDWPMPADWPDFPSAQQMCTYYQDFAEAHNLDRHLRFGARVQRVWPAEGGGWWVQCAGGEPERFKGVAVCNGHHWDRVLPEWASDFDGTVLHSKDYKRPDQLRDQRVLVVGGGNSGCDLVSEASRVGAAADWSLRRGYHFLPKTLLGVPTVELMTPWMPVSVQRALLGLAVALTVGSYEKYGLPKPDHRLFETHPTVNSEVFHALSHGKARARPDVVGVDGRTVHFADGSSDAYDLIACATGYRVSFPFLPPGMVPVHGKAPQVLAGMVVRGQRDLYVVGGFQPRYGLGPLARPAAVLLAHWIGLQGELPVPLADALDQLGVQPATTHLVDPHAAIRQLRRAMRLDGFIRRAARKVARRGEGSAPATAPAGS